MSCLGLSECEKRSLIFTPINRLSYYQFLSGSLRNWLAILDKPLFPGLDKSDRMRSMITREYIVISSYDEEWCRKQNSLVLTWGTVWTEWLLTGEKMMHRMRIRMSYRKKSSLKRDLEVRKRCEMEITNFLRWEMRWREERYRTVFISSFSGVTLSTNENKKKKKSRKKRRDTWCQKVRSEILSYFRHPLRLWFFFMWHINPISLFDLHILFPKSLLVMHHYFKRRSFYTAQVPSMWIHRIKPKLMHTHEKRRSYQHLR